MYNLNFQLDEFAIDFIESVTIVNQFKLPWLNTISGWKIREMALILSMITIAISFYRN